MNKRIVLRRDLPVTLPIKKKRRASKNSARTASMPDDKDRLNLQIDRDLKAWAQNYAKRHHTSLTQLITDHFVCLKKEEEGDGVQQI